MQLGTDLLGLTSARIMLFYSRPEHPDEGLSNYTGARSHEIVLPTILALQDAHRKLRAISERLRELGVSSE